MIRQTVDTMNAIPLTSDLDPSPRALRFYLVEDSEVIRQNLTATLAEMLGMQEVGWASTEADALDWLDHAAADCDLMIIDIFLTRGTGLEVLRRARAACPDTRLVVLSNYATPEMRRRCLALGADRVFDKSAELEDLIAYCETLAHAPRV